MDKKISELDALTEITLDDLLVMVNSPGTTPITKKITFGDVLKSIKPGDGGITDYVDWADDGTQTLHGAATTFDDITFEMTPSRQGQQSKPDWDATNLGFLFPRNDTSEYVDIIVQMPHRWKEGSTIYPHVHCVQSNNGQAVFKMDYKWYNQGDAIPVGTTTYTMQTYLITYVSGSICQLIHGEGIDGTGYTFSSLLKLRLYRDDNGYVGDILVDQFDIHFEIDSFGTSSQYAK
jgi:hypothetical protein